MLNPDTDEYMLRVVKKKILFTLSLAILFFGLFAFQVSAGGVRFSDKVQIFDREVCQAKKVNLLGSVVCYLIDKTNELSNSVQVLNSQLSANDATDATQSAKISQLEQRISALECQVPILVDS